MPFEDRLQLVRSRLGVAITPAERTARAGQEPGASLTAAISPEVPSMTFSPATVAARATPVTAPAPAADPYAGEAPGFVPAGYQMNPEATNFGRLAQARTDVPRFVPIGTASPGISPTQLRERLGGIDVNSYPGSRYANNSDPRGITPPAGPGIDVNSYTGSLYAPGAASNPGAGTMLPTGNPTAKMALLRSEMPRASRSELSAMGNLAYNRPEAFNAAMAGSRLDPVMNSQRVAQADASLASTRTSTAATAQGMQFSAALQPGNLAQQEATLVGTRQGTEIQAQDAARRTNTDTAAQNFFSEEDNAAIAAAAQGGAPAAVLFDMAQLARQRAEDIRRRDAATPQLTTIAGREAVLSNGNVQFIPQPRPAPTSTLAKLQAERAQAEANGDLKRVDEYNQMIKKQITPTPTYAEQVANMRPAGTPTPAPAAPAPKPAAPAAPAQPTAPVAPPAAQSAFSAYEGKPVRGPDGQIYMIKNGKPVKQ